jgi:hypothetical protein
MRVTLLEEQECVLESKKENMHAYQNRLKSRACFVPPPPPPPNAYPYNKEREKGGLCKLGRLKEWAAQLR